MLVCALLIPSARRHPEGRGTQRKSRSKNGVRGFAVEVRSTWQRALKKAPGASERIRRRNSKERDTMKKLGKTLNLNRETLRTLSGNQLDGLAGGAQIPQTSVCSVTCPIYCYIKASDACTFNTCH